VSTRPFFGWVIVAVSGLGLATGIATVVAATFSIFVGPMRDEFGWDASLPFWAPLAVPVTSAIAAPAVGSLVDRFGARRIVLVSFVLVALILASFYFMKPSIWGLYLRYVALGAFCLGTTHIAFARVIALWFDRRRGLGLGLALAGVGFGGIILPLVCQALIEWQGWRVAYPGLAAIVFGIALPVLALTLFDSPARFGQAADGDPVTDVTASQQPDAPVLIGLALREAVRDRFYWLMMLTFLLIGIGLQSMMIHLVPMLRARGVEPMLAAGAEVDLIAYLTSRYFGLRQDGRIYGTYYAMYSLGGGAGRVVTAQGVAQTGGYDAVLWLLVALLAVAAVLLAMFRPFPDWSAPRAAPRAQAARAA
jgi:MFS family permease